MKGTKASILNADEQNQLKELAWHAIRNGLLSETPLRVDSGHLPASLLHMLASFVSLHRHGALRGCIGTLEAYRPLAEDVVGNAYSAAFQDPRFPPLRDYELEGLELKISVLSSPSPMGVQTEQDVLEQLQPGTDGLVIELGPRKATFLPAVWEQLPDPVDFLYELKRKAGLDPAEWNPATQVQRYTTLEF